MDLRLGNEAHQLPQRAFRARAADATVVERQRRGALLGDVYRASGAWKRAGTAMAPASSTAALGGP